jgi:hypothetical protein
VKETGCGHARLFRSGVPIMPNGVLTVLQVAAALTAAAADDANTAHTSAWARFI